MSEPEKIVLYDGKPLRMRFSSTFVKELSKSEFLFPRALVGRIELEVDGDKGVLVLIQSNPDDPWLKYDDRGGDDAP